VIFVFVCFPGWAQVSSLHSIFLHCSLVQPTCSKANSSRRIQFFSEISSRVRAFRRANPSFLKAALIASIPQFHPKTSGIWSHGRRRLSLELQTQSIKNLRLGVLRNGFRPRLFFFGVRGCLRAYSIWREVKYNWSTI